MEFIDPLNKREKKKFIRHVRKIVQGTINEQMDKFIGHVRKILQDAINEQVDKYSDTLNIINEARTRKVVIRGGKRKVKYFANSSNKKIVGGKAVTMKASERIKRGRGAIKAAKKRKGKQARITKKYMKSMKKRKRYNLKKQH
jgi:malonyl CoA-acyl carrier protein transacylase